LCKFKQSLFLTAKAGAYGARYTHQYWFTLLLQRSDGGTRVVTMARSNQAIAEINQNGGINGRPLNAIHLDPQSDDVLFRAMAEELITEHEVNVIFGGYTSSSRKAMSPIVEKYRRLLFYSQLYEGFEFSENISMAVPRLIRIVYSWLTTSRLSLGHGFI
jgi:hypothetical protein